MNFRKTSRDAFADAEAFIRENLVVLPVPSIAGISLYTAHPGSGLRRLAGDDDGPAPYWAYRWAGGLALAHHVLALPEAVRGRRVLDLGAGSGLVGIAAAKAGAASVLSAEIDPNGIAAIGLNAGLNGVTVMPCGDDLVGGEPPEVDLVLVGDLFYAREIAERVAVFLDRCLTAGIAVLVGDPGREFLPLARLDPVAEYAVADVGSAAAPARVYAFVA